MGSQGLAPDRSLHHLEVLTNPDIPWSGSRDTLSKTAADGWTMGAIHLIPGAPPPTHCLSASV